MPSGFALHDSALPASGVSNGMSCRGMTHRPTPSSGAGRVSRTIPFASRIEFAAFPLSVRFHDRGMSTSVSSASKYSSSSLPKDSERSRPGPSGAYAPLPCFLPFFPPSRSVPDDDGPPSRSAPDPPPKQHGILPERFSLSL
eukprot:31542-Pelagococcus_subviridis.AAC.21